MLVGLKIRTLLEKGVLRGTHDDETMSEINKELRPLNYQAIQNNTKTLVVLKDLEPMPFDNVKLLNNLENFINNGVSLEKATLNWLTEMDWYANGEFTDVFLIQNEEYLLEKFEKVFLKCKFCNLVVKGAHEHDFCLSVYNKRMSNMTN